MITLKKALARCCVIGHDLSEIHIRKTPATVHLPLQQGNSDTSIPTFLSEIRRTIKVKYKVVPLREKGKKVWYYYITGIVGWAGGGEGGRNGLKLMKYLGV